MRIRANPIALGREAARQDMAKAFPGVFVLATDSDVVRAGRKPKPECVVMIIPANPHILAAEKSLMLGLGEMYCSWKARGLINGIAALFGAVSLYVSSVLFSGKKSDVFLSAILLVPILRLECALLADISYDSEVKKLLRIGLGEFEKHPNGTPIVKLGTSPATSSDTRQ